MIAAPILDSALLRSPARIDTRRLPKEPTLGIEAELAFRIGKPLPARPSGGYTALEVATAIDSTHAAIELLESRWHTQLASPRSALLADFLSNEALVVGDAASPWSDLDRVGIHVAVEVNGRTVIEQVGGNSAGDPLNAVVALAEHLTKRQLSLEPGQIVTTGTYTGVHFAALDEEVTVRFRGLPEVRLRLTAE